MTNKKAVYEHYVIENGFGNKYIKTGEESCEILFISNTTSGENKYLKYGKPYPIHEENNPALIGKKEYDKQLRRYKKIENAKTLSHV